jgi:hypothetical protein
MADLVLGGNSPAVSRATLEATVGRASQFLFALTRTPPALNNMRLVGYTKAEHDRGFVLVNALKKEIDETLTDRKVDDAIQELDAWDEKGVGLVRPALTAFPDVRDAVLEGITPVAGIGAVLNVEKILTRLTAAEGTERGRAALARLTRSGLGAEKRAELAALVATAKGSAAFDAAIVTDEAYERDLLALRDWYYEWSEIARQVVNRREHLIRMGLAERRSTTTDEMPIPDDLVIEDPTPFITDPGTDPSPNGA